MSEFIMYGSIQFLTLLLIELIVLFISIGKESGSAAAVSLFLTGLCLQFMGDTDIIGFVLGNPLVVGSFLLAYIPIGVIWGVLKWRHFCVRKASQYKQFKDEWVKKRYSVEKDVDCSTIRLSDIDVQKLDDAIANYNLDLPYRSDNKIVTHLSVSRYKHDIFRWMGFWFISMPLTFGKILFKDVFHMVYNKIAGFMQSLSDKQFDKV